MKISDKDYVLLAGSGKAATLVSVIDAANPKKIKGLVDQSHLETPDKGTREVLEFSVSDVMANLGRRPKFGTAYGAKVETLISRHQHDWFGKIRLYADALHDEANVKQLRKLMKISETMLIEHGMPQLPLIFDVRNPQGKYAGMYKFRSGDLDVLTIRIGEEDLNEDHMKYIVGHEYAHGVWARYLSPVYKSKWIELYHKATDIKVYGQKELDRMRVDLISEGSIGAFKKSLEEDEDKKLFSTIIKHIKSTHSLDQNHLQLMLMLEEDLDDLWPNHLEVGDTSLLISDYGRKSPEELFAEVFAYWMRGVKLPAGLLRAVEKTMKHVKKNMGGAQGETQYEYRTDKKFAERDDD